MKIIFVSSFEDVFSSAIFELILVDFIVKY